MPTFSCFCIFCVQNNRKKSYLKCLKMNDFCKNFCAGCKCFVLFVAFFSHRIFGFSCRPHFWDTACHGGHHRHRPALPTRCLSLNGVFPVHHAHKTAHVCHPNFTQSGKMCVYLSVRGLHRPREGYIQNKKLNTLPSKKSRTPNK